jgi:crossover junction endodeoxyribonuclease RusA
MHNLDLFISGVPSPQGSVRAFGSRVVQGGSASSRMKLGDWRTAVAAETRRWVEHEGNPAPHDGAVGVDLLFYMPKPPSLPKYRKRPSTKPDLDKLIRSTLDALTKVVFTDDSRVTRIHADETYAIEHTPGMYVHIDFYDVETAAAKEAA